MHDVGIEIVQLDLYLEGVLVPVRRDLHAAEPQFAASGARFPAARTISPPANFPPSEVRVRYAAAAGR